MAEDDYEEDEEEEEDEDEDGDEDPLYVDDDEEIEDADDESEEVHESEVKELEPAFMASKLDSARDDRGLLLSAYCASS